MTLTRRPFSFLKGPRRMAARSLLLGTLAALLAVTGVASAASAASGPDVSNYQHPNNAAIDWNQVRAAGNTFTFIKATEGPSSAGGYYTNNWFARDWAASANAGLYRGAYHFARPQYPLDSAVAQARYFVSVTGTMQGRLDLPPVLDLEMTGGLPPADLAQWTRLWLQETERLTGRRPIIYTGYYFWNDHVQASDLGGYRLWMARWTTGATPYPLPSGWSTWGFWQYSSSGSVPGIIGNVDINRFCCPDSTLSALAGGGNAAAGNPYGSLDVATRDLGSIFVAGWAIDPDTTAALDIHFYVDGRVTQVATANTTRADVGSAFPGWGNNHGFTASVPVAPGDHQVCAYAINRDTGTENTSLGCRIVTGPPIGSLDVVTSPAGELVDVAGWTLDPDTTAPLAVHVYVDGQIAGAATANLTRADVGNAYPAYGAAHGYRTSVAVAGGTHRVCTYALNVIGSAGNPELGCRSITVNFASPYGSIDVISAGAGSVYVQGWAVDPDTTASIPVHVYIDGVGVPLLANQSRPDVAAVLSGYGAAHGFSVKTGLGLAPGPHNVCIYAINALAGSNTTMICTTVTMPTGSPFGSVDSAVSTGGGNVTVNGWAIDPDTAAPIDVHVYLDGHIIGIGRADQIRNDVGAMFPVFGANHGYGVAIAGVTPGTHQLCVYGINAPGGTGSNQAVCRTVTTG